MFHSKSIPRIHLPAIAAFLLLCSCSPPDKDKKVVAPPPAADTAIKAPRSSVPVFNADNPFFAASPLPFHAPPFNRISDSDYQPAIEEGIRQQRAEVMKIASNPEPPTFRNTVVALEKSGALLHRVLAVFKGINDANSNSILQKVGKTEAPRLAALENAIYLNDRLFQRIKKIYEARDSLKLTPESRRLLNVVYHHFLHVGVSLSAADKNRLKVLNQKAAVLSSVFTRKLFAANRDGALLVDDRSKLDGLTPAQIAMVQKVARQRDRSSKAHDLADQWLIPLSNTTQQPLLRYLRDRGTRKALFEASWSRAEKGGNNDTRETVAQLAKTRAELAHILGFPNYAAWKLEDTMAKKPAAVMHFLHQIRTASVAKARVQAATIQHWIDRDQARRHQRSFRLQAWDWSFYMGQMHQTQYHLKQYFELNNVLKKGVFYAAHQLYGLTFKERTDLPVYQPDVRVFEVFDHNGKALALFYGDYFRRDNKQGGAWSDNFVGQSKLLGTSPVVYIVTNFKPPTPGYPTLLSFEQVIALFHEFGHALNAIFSDTFYPRLSGLHTPRDFLEFPSQFNQHLASEPRILKHYALHYKTGQPMPRSLLSKITKGELFNLFKKSSVIQPYLAAALLDMNWHMLPASAPLQSVDTFEAASLRKDGMDFGYLRPRYRSSYFLHIWTPLQGSGYAANYYAYLWSLVLAEDAFAYFKKHGGFNRANGERFRKMILSRGNSEDLSSIFSHWCGHNPDIKPMLKKLHLKVTAKRSPGKTML